MISLYIAKDKKDGRLLLIKFAKGASVIPTWTSPENAVPYLTDIRRTEDYSVEPIKIEEWTDLKARFAPFSEQIFLHLMDNFKSVQDS